MRISVVIPTVGRSSLPAAVVSAGWADEIVIVSDGAHRAAQYVVGAEKNINTAVVYVQIPHFGHQGRPRNIGHRLVSGDFVGFLDDDDAYVEGVGDKIRAALEADPRRAHTFMMRKMAGREQFEGSPCTFIPTANTAPGDWWREKNRGVDTGVFQRRAQAEFGEVTHAFVIVQLRPHVKGVVQKGV